MSLKEELSEKLRISLARLKKTKKSLDETVAKLDKVQEDDPLCFYDIQILAEEVKNLSEDIKESATQIKMLREIIRKL